MTVVERTHAAKIRSRTRGLRCLLHNLAGDIEAGGDSHAAASVVLAVEALDETLLRLGALPQDSEHPQ
jgi:hypothetical protein